ncbi:aldose epimerase family protein [Flavivirga sp. 57AJ16]|uniref:aldose epimerase family protein n=1 Tax=Flavivirga sp. 57AJ16 TaxID=3025307 RepID=UPI002366AFFB|nr:aldose epimerase family protein [Flavivirga sp. 57AJ16]MDD7885122.1 galactose mutarotase [Flavivirga sp. 57AJ16]
MYLKKVVLPLAILFICSACKDQNLSLKTNEIKLLNKDAFKKEVDGKLINLYVLKNKDGLVSEITNYGGKVVSLWVPDKLGHFEDIVLGHSNIDDYLTSKEKYFGALVGRYGNRIANGTFSINGKEYHLAKNNGENHLHGGNLGYDSVIWEATQLDEQTLELHYISQDLEEGYPGTLSIKVIYQLTDNNELKVEYWATTDQTTVVNLTHHSFFNLKGHGNGTINDHQLLINAPYYTPVKEGLIPTGKITTVENTPFDFQKLTAIGKRVNDNNQQLEYGFGYDHNFVLNQNLEALNYAAKVKEPVSGRIMEVFTNEPGLQFYGGNFLDGSIKGKDGKAYKYRTAFCLETQHFPDSPNNSHFPSTVLNPGKQYYSICIYKFSTSK